MTKVNTRLGAIEGVADGDIRVFRGIRYGQAPIGDLRFKAARMAGPWQGTYDATKIRHRSWQPQPEGIFTELLERDPAEYSRAEDCLFLNIYTPGCDDGRRPVLFWIHGGAFGSGSGYDYNGTALAAQGDVVVVTINYRLGFPGFLDLSAYGDDYQGSASNGIGDQILALRWVAENIGDFGGDPGNVTIFGESAGGASVNCLIAAPSADGLYHRAIVHSGTMATTPPIPIATSLAEHLGVGADGLLDKLASLDGEALLNVQMASALPFGAVVDGTIVTRPTTQAIAEHGARCVPYIAGSNANEGTLLSLAVPEEGHEAITPMIAAMALDGADPTAYLERLRTAYPGASATRRFEHVWNDMFRRASITAAAAATAANDCGWLYRFDLPATIMDGSLGATHAAEIAFTFNAFSRPDLPGIVMHDGNDPAVAELARKWSDTVLAFARTGNPNGGGLPEWPVYRADERRSLVLDRASYIADASLDTQQRARWETP